MLIDKDKAVEVVAAYLFLNDSLRGEVKEEDYKVFAEAVLKDVPAQDIVRCKECRSYDDKDYGEPTRYCKWHESVVYADDFCSYGERSE